MQQYWKDNYRTESVFTDLSKHKVSLTWLIMRSDGRTFKRLNCHIPNVFFQNVEPRSESYV